MLKMFDFSVFFFTESEFQIIDLGKVYDFFAGWKVLKNTKNSNGMVWNPEY